MSHSQTDFSEETSGGEQLSRAYYPNRSSKRATGTRYEEAACGYLTEQGLTVIENNYRTRYGEIDIIAMDGDTYVFCEVKFRSSMKAGDPAEAVGAAKQRTIRTQAAVYMAEHGLNDLTPCRFDVVSILGGDIRWITNAF